MLTIFGGLFSVLIAPVGPAENIRLPIPNMSGF